jgi:hypothetical protein
MNLFLPRLLLKMKGGLEPGQINPLPKLPMKELVFQMPNANSTSVGGSDNEKQISQNFVLGTKVNDESPRTIIDIPEQSKNLVIGSTEKNCNPEENDPDSKNSEETNFQVSSTNPSDKCQSNKRKRNHDSEEDEPFTKKSKDQEESTLV